MEPELDLKYCQEERLNHVNWDQEEGMEKQCVTQEGMEQSRCMQEWVVGVVMEFDLEYCQGERLNHVG